MNHEKPDTAKEFATIKRLCRDIYISKYEDYGTSWRLMRAASLTDQLFIKAKRIRTLELCGSGRVHEGIVPEYVAIINYSVMERIQLAMGPGDDLGRTEALSLYDRYFDSATSLMLDKNHDYDEAWRQMRVESMTDIILSKLHRIKRIEDNCGRTSVSEGIDSNLMDIINYAVFCLIRLGAAAEA